MSAEVATFLLLEFNEPTADAFVQYYGRMTIPSPRGPLEYRWGGTSRGSRVLADAAEDRLQRAQNHGITVTPFWTSGQGGTKCVVGFRLEQETQPLPTQRRGLRLCRTSRRPTRYGVQHTVAGATGATLPVATDGDASEHAPPETPET